MHLKIAFGGRTASGRVAVGKWTADNENKGSHMSVRWTQCIWTAGSGGFIRGQGDKKFSWYIQGGVKNIGDRWGIVAVEVAWDVEGKKIVKMQLIVYYLWVSISEMIKGGCSIILSWRTVLYCGGISILLFILFFSLFLYKEYILGV